MICPECRTDVDTTGATSKEVRMRGHLIASHNMTVSMADKAMGLRNAKDRDRKCDYCKHAYKYHGGASMSCEVGRCDCAGFQEPEMENEEESMEKGFETNKSLAARGAMRGAAQYGSVPTGILNTIGDPADDTFVCDECGETERAGLMTKKGVDKLCENCATQMGLFRANSLFRFTDSKGEVLDITAVEEENAWEQLAGKFGLSVAAAKGHGLKIEMVNKGDDYSSLSDKQLKELEEHYGNALDDHRKLGDAEMSNELHKCLMNIKAERKRRGNGY